MYQVKRYGDDLGREKTKIIERAVRKGTRCWAAGQYSRGHPWWDAFHVDHLGLYIASGLIKLTLFDSYHTFGSTLSYTVLQLYI